MKVSSLSITHPTTAPPPSADGAKVQFHPTDPFSLGMDTHETWYSVPTGASHAFVVDGETALECSEQGVQLHSSETFPLTYVAFRRARQDHLYMPSLHLNLASHSGLTILTRFRFTGDIGTYERVFDFSNGQSTNNIVVTRVSNQANTLNCTMLEGGVNVAVMNLAFTHDAWHTCLIQYERATLQVRVYLNDLTTPLATTTLSAGLVDRTTHTNYIGRSAWPSDAYANLDLQGLVVYDTFLSAADIQSCLSAMYTFTPKEHLPQQSFLKTALLPRPLPTPARISQWDTFQQHIPTRCPLVEEWWYVRFVQDELTSPAPISFSDATASEYSWCIRVRGQGTPTADESFLQLAGLLVTRSGTTTQLRVRLQQPNGSVVFDQTSIANVLRPSEWVTIRTRYGVDSQTLQVYVDHDHAPLLSGQTTASFEVGGSWATNRLGSATTTCDISEVTLTPSTTRWTLDGLADTLGTPLGEWGGLTQSNASLQPTLVKQSWEAMATATFTEGTMAHPYTPAIPVLQQTLFWNTGLPSLVLAGTRNAPIGFQTWFSFSFTPTQTSGYLLLTADASYHVVNYANDSITIRVRDESDTVYSKTQTWVSAAGGGGTRSGVLFPFQCWHAFMYANTQSRTLYVELDMDGSDDAIQFEQGKWNVALNEYTDK